MVSLVRRAFRLLPAPARDKIKGWVVPKLISFTQQYETVPYMLLENEVKASAAKFETSHYQIPVLLRLLALGRFTSVKGARVCEIGGDGNFGIARLWHDLTATPVVVSNPMPETTYSDEELASMGVSLCRKPFEETPVADESFDIIYGCAVMEHIVPMREFFACAFEKLAPGGWAIIHGCPLWHCYIGHHAYVRCDGINYFMGQPDCPVPDFAHLYMDEKEMHAHLTQEKGLPETHAEALCHQIYRSDYLNRLTIADICAAIAASPWQEMRFATDLDYTAHEARDFLASKQLSVKDVQRGTLYLAVKKPDHL